MPDIRLALQQAWLKRGLISCVLWPVSLIYGLLFGLRKMLYRLGVFRSQQLPVPVIVVGNVVAGGGGKTPLSIALVQRLKQQGYQNIRYVEGGMSQWAAKGWPLVAPQP